jgi:hypothetical protein
MIIIYVFLVDKCCPRKTKNVRKMIIYGCVLPGIIKKMCNIHSTYYLFDWWHGA